MLAVIRSVCETLETDPGILQALDKHTLSCMSSVISFAILRQGLPKLPRLALNSSSASWPSSLSLPGSWKYRAMPQALAPNPLYYRCCYYAQFGMSHSSTELLSDLPHCCQLAISELELKPKVWLQTYGLVTSMLLDITTYCMKVRVKEGSWSERKATRADFTAWRKGLELPFCCLDVTLLAKHNH